MKPSVGWKHSFAQSYSRNCVEFSGQFYTPAAPPSKTTPGRHWVESSVDLSASLEALNEKQISYPCRESNQNFSVVQRLF
jgi:hypothetical protein